MMNGESLAAKLELYASIRMNAYIKLLLKVHREHKGKGLIYKLFGAFRLKMAYRKNLA
jgi:hypothetical protein